MNPDDLPFQIASSVWVVFAAVWIALAARVKSTARSETWASRAGHVLPLVLSVYLFSNQQQGELEFLNQRFIGAGLTVAILGDLLSIAGVGFAIWARLALGRNWSASVMQRRDHELITSGPFYLVRHPIYTGILTGMLGFAIEVGAWRALLGVVIAWLAFWRKYLLEERFMEELFGSRYVDYRRRVPALVPVFVRHA